MKLHRYCCLGALALLPITFASLLLAQDKPAKPGKDAPKPDEAEMMKKWMAASTPGAGHKALDSQAGEWEITMRAWTPGSSDAPQETKGTATTKWILGGRFLQSDVTGVMMGMPMTGLGITGYDNFKKKYVTYWIDSLNTAMYTAEGTFDATGKTFTYHGKMDEPMTGEKDKPVKFVHRILSADKHVFEIHEPALGANSKTFEMAYSRKK